jgi:tetratricopeptide (TPR) repeat protein
MLGRTLNFAAWTGAAQGRSRPRRSGSSASRSGSSPRWRIARRCARPALARELLVSQGRIDEAERFALAARETVGPHDVTSLATTTMSLGLVRAAQGRDEEAEELLRQAYDTLAETEHRQHQCELLQALGSVPARPRPRRTRRTSSTRAARASWPSRQHRLNRLVDSRSGDSEITVAGPPELPERLLERLGRSVPSP